MDAFLMNIPHPDVDINAEINLNVMCRTMNSRDWDYGVASLEHNPNQDRACIYWRQGDSESQWLMRGPNGFVMRIIKNNQVVYQRPF
jgi:hypothetical protein